MYKLAAECSALHDMEFTNCHSTQQSSQCYQYKYPTLSKLGKNISCRAETIKAVVFPITAPVQQGMGQTCKNGKQVIE